MSKTEKSMNKQFDLFEEELKKIVEIDSSWGFKSFYGLTTYWAFLEDYCVSMCVHIREVPITYVVTDKNDKFYYTGYDKNEALDAVKKIVEKHK